MVQRLLSHTLLLACCAAPALRAQEPAGERTTIQYYRDNTQIGSDEYSIRQQGTESVLRSRVTVRQRGERVTTEITFDRNWQPRQLQMEVRGGANFSTHVQFGERRITFRSVSPTGESARELPRRGVIVLIDDDMPSLYAVLQHLEPGAATLFQVRSGDTSPATLIDHGMTPAPGDTLGLRLRHIELQTDGGAHHAWFDESGQPVSVEIPALRVRATRRSED